MVSFCGACLAHGVCGVIKNFSHARLFGWWPLHELPKGVELGLFCLYLREFLRLRCREASWCHSRPKTMHGQSSSVSWRIKDLIFPEMVRARFSREKDRSPGHTLSDAGPL